MSKNTVHTRIRLKNDTEANWNKSHFIPLQGEAIIYNSDDTHPFSRIKVGDGVNLVTNLPFINNDNTAYCLPEDYGAVGDGETDDYAALMDTLEAAANSKLPILLTNIYIISQPLTLSNQSDITIIGTKDSLIQIKPSDVDYTTGNDWAPGAVADINPYGANKYYEIEKRTIIPNGYNACDHFFNTNENSSCNRGIFSFYQCNNILIKNVNFDCNGKNHPDYTDTTLSHRYCFALDLYGCSNITIEGCSFDNLYNYYIYCNNILDSLVIKNNHFEATIPNQAQCYNMLGIANCGLENNLTGEILIQNNYFQGCECNNIIYNSNAIICTNNYNPMIIENNVIKYCGRGYNNTPVHIDESTVVAFADHRLMPIDFYTNCHNIIVRNNNIISTMGGMRLCGVQNALIENNQFSFTFYSGLDELFNEALNGDPFIWICNRQQENPSTHIYTVSIAKNITIRNNQITLNNQHNSVIEVVETRSAANINDDLIENIFIQNNIINSAAGSANPILFDGIVKHLYIDRNIFSNDKITIRCTTFTNTPTGTYTGEDIQIINNYINHSNNFYCIDIQAVRNNIINNLIIKNNYVKKGNRSSYAAIKSAIPAKIIGNVVGGLIQITNPPGEGFVMDNYFESDNDTSFTANVITNAFLGNVVHKNNYLDYNLIEI